MTDTRNVQLLMALTALAIMTVSSLGCGGPTRRYYYALSYPHIESVERQIPDALHQGRLRVKRFTIGEAYNRPQLVYRQSPWEFQYYVYRYWAAKPQKMMRDIFHEHIKRTGLFEGVELEYGDTKFQYELGGEINAIEEYDSAGDWYAHLAMNLELTRLSDGKVIWRYSFDRKRKVEKKNPVYVIQSLSGILRDEMGPIMAGMDQALSKLEGVQPTLQATPVMGDELPEVDACQPESQETLRKERPDTVLDEPPAN